MPYDGGNCNKRSASVYDEMRAFNRIDLTCNEKTVWIAYRMEMDEASRHVRGKTQEQIREGTGLGRSQFAAASASLQRRGLIECHRHRNAPQTIIVLDPADVHQQVRETQTSGNVGYPEIRKSRSPESGIPGNPDAGSPENPDCDIYTAPVSTPVSAPPRARADADAPPSNVIAVTNWNTAFLAQPGSDDRPPLITRDRHGRIHLNGQTRAFWLKKFGGNHERLDLALLEVGGEINEGSRRPLEADVESRLARKAADKHDRDRRYENAKIGSRKVVNGGVAAALAEMISQEATA